MKTQQKIILACCIYSSAGLVMAETADNGWTGQATLGLMTTKGNTDSKSLNAALDTTYHKNAWTHQFSASIMRAEFFDTENANNYLVAPITKYSLSDVAYTFLTAWYYNNKFSGYDGQSSISVGYGRKVIDSEKHQLTIEVGPGIAYYKENTAEANTETYPVGVVSLEYAWKLTDSTDITNSFTTESGSKNTYIDNALALSVAINKRFSLSLGLHVTHNTEALTASEATDTTLTTNLVYSFSP